MEFYFKLILCQIFLRGRNGSLTLETKNLWDEQVSISSGIVVGTDARQEPSVDGAMSSISAHWRAVLT